MIFDSTTDRGVAALGLCGALLLCTGCPGDDGGGTGESSSSGAETTTPMTTTMTMTSPNDSTGQPPVTATGSDSSGGTGDSSSSGESSGSSGSGEADTGTTTGGMGLCEVMLPPPLACPALAVAGPWPVDWLPYDRALPGMGPADELTDADDPELGGFIPDPDGGTGIECDIFAQNCMAGQKCMPWANDGGGSWNATRCSDIDAMPDQVGDVCTVVGSGVSGIDSCDIGQMCWDVDAMTGEGVCIEMCSCSELNPVCNTANTICSISNMGVLALCLEVCNPLDPMGCAAGQGCYPAGDFFQCAPDASGMLGAPGEACAFLNACDPGTVCVGGAGVPGCGGGACCTSMCDIDDGAAPCLAGQDCVPWYEPGFEPDACLGQAGVCFVP